MKFRDLRDENTKAFLVINVSNACNLTGMNFRQLSQLHEELGPKGLKIVAVPCLQYDKNKQKELSLAKCGILAEDAIRTKFKVDFTVLRSDIVNGEECCDLYKYLRAHCDYFNKDLKKKKSKFNKYKSQKTGKIELSPKQREKIILKQLPYNFSKFILDRDGNVIKFFEPAVFPKTTKPVIQKLLN
jgi:glutathione peroxidase